jgi:hypothetical protein
MKKLWSGLGMALATILVAGPALAQESAAKTEIKPAPSPSQAVLEQWNDIGRKLIAMAEDFPFAHVFADAPSRFRCHVLLHRYGAGKKGPLRR